MVERINAEVLDWLQQRIEELERELGMLKTLMSILTGQGPGERVEEVKAGRKRIGFLYMGEYYVRLVPGFDMVLNDEIKDYLDEAVEDIRRKQEREGVEEEERAQLVIVNNNGAVEEIWIRGIEGIAETIRAKSALKYAAELAWNQYRRALKQGV